MKKKKKKLKSRKDRDKGRLSGAEESKKPVAAPQIVVETECYDYPSSFKQQYISILMIHSSL